MKNDYQIDLGSVHVSKRVIAELVMSAIEQLDGVKLIEKSLGSIVFEVFGRQEFPGVDVKVDDEREVSLELQVMVRYGMNIPDIARQIQESVKATIDKTLDIPIKDININVQGIERGEK